MSSETLFYVLGIVLVIVALVVALGGLRSEDRFPSTGAMRLTAFLFAALVAATATFSVLNARDEQEHRNAELAAEAEEAGEEAPQGGAEAEQGGGEPAGAEAGGGKPAPAKQPQAKGPGGTLKLVADTTAIAYDRNALASKPGEVTIDFDNPSQVEHDVAIAKGSQEIAKTDLISQGKTSVSTALAPGKYVFYCTVPGHREAGMEGPLTVK